jgi:serine/threonine-protein kinase RsbW
MPFTAGKDLLDTQGLYGAETLPEKTLTIRIEPRIGSIPMLLDRLEAYAEAMRLSPKVAYRISILCEEFAANTAMHGGDTASYVEINVAAHARHLRVSIEDDGAAFDPPATSAPDTTMPIEAREIGGLGIHFIRSMVRDLHYERRKNCNHLIATLDIDT